MKCKLGLGTEQYALVLQANKLTCTRGECALPFLSNMACAPSAQCSCKDVEYKIKMHSYADVNSQINAIAIAMTVYFKSRVNVRYNAVTFSNV